jgi:hypothetical protein
VILVSHTVRDITRELLLQLFPRECRWVGARSVLLRSPNQEPPNAPTRLILAAALCVAASAFAQPMPGAARAADAHHGRRRLRHP